MGENGGNKNGKFRYHLSLASPTSDLTSSVLDLTSSVLDLVLDLTSFIFDLTPLALTREETQNLIFFRRI